jgi:hypothetical protein
MKKLCLPLCAVLVSSIAAVQEPGRAAPPAQGTTTDLAKLAWLSGTWALKNGDSTTEEHWRPLQGSMLLGTSHTFDDQRTQFFEFLSITTVRGKLSYVAMPAGKKATVFPLARIEDKVVDFENGEHDYPQRIRYERTEKGVTATISLLDGTNAQEFVFEKR